MRLGISGHQSLGKRLAEHGVCFSEEAAWEWVAASLWSVLCDAANGDVVVVTSLAAGADQLFARLGLEAGARLQIVIPSTGYEDTFHEEQDLAGFLDLLEAGDVVSTLPYESPSEVAFLAAGRQMVDLSDQLVAVWDGEEAQGLGGTGDVVVYARDLGKPVIQINPIQRTITRY